MTGLSINLKRLKSRLDKVNEIGKLVGGGVRRLSLTNEDKEVRDLLVSWFDELGLDYQLDEMGNMVGIWKNATGGDPITIGSHLDTVGTGGCFDGSLGVVAALEVVQTIQEAGIEPEKPIAVVNFTNEEGVRFTPDMMGSYALAGLGGVDALWNAPAEEDNSLLLKDELERIGYLGEMKCGDYQADSYFELHIEQGPVLEREHLTIGAVEKVQGIFWTEYIIKGTANHAGTTPMNLRHDSGFVTSKINVFVRELATDFGGAQVGTVGINDYYPNLINVVPQQVRMTVDLRNTDKEELVQAQARLDDYIQIICAMEQVDFERKELVRFDPVDFDAEMIDLVEESARELGHSVKRMPSGAGHDAQMMAAICPATMIFIPSKDGISHNTNEFSNDEDIGAGTNVLLQAVLKRMKQ